ncbi:hypothetical protein [Brachyspira hampsonii]|uniref:Cell surface protein n=1 Tax=Brachyspira hampsonii TaxID=1287055 RepID=A0AAC9TSF6_9SPIR|nr:hypothetical protein [Brachyspira hampsonii]ASJ21016.1 hypothetical protein BHAMNSH16_04890 [Brachyspira hampsonii]ELV05721.1 hypothetical protein H263_08484 [Brachyspira hampsonii 30599]MBW5380215.1 hypothetical protein [Brachyspira hampsonii]MBW5408770.1 hypothetical protein [Brachyspira hampsonii]OEJ13255.1 hypothetical protein A9496_02280 [Brachyspira hampsonii]
MKKVFITIISLVLFTNGILFSQQAANTQTNPALQFFNVYPGSMKMLSFYVEYASGDLTSLGTDPKAKRMMENFDTKLTYLQTLKSVPWLGFGFIFQAQFDNPSVYDPTWKEGSRPGKNTSNPFSNIELTANVHFLNTFSLGLTSSGDFVFMMYLNKRLPDVAAFKSHSLTFMAQQNIYIRGNQYDAKTGALTQGWYDGTEFRVAYQMRFNDWFALRPEIQFKILSGAQTDFNKWYWIRFNPRLQFFLEEWTFFIEPRLFYGGIFKQDMSALGIGSSEFNKNGWGFELKVGIDLTKLFFD